MENTSPVLHNEVVLECTRRLAMGSLFDGTKHMDEIEKIYKQMEDNCPAPRSTSQKLWELRRACDIAPHHRAPETMLEKAVATLAQAGTCPDWFNQCPVASGITVSSMSRQASQAKNKKSNVDLVHWDTANKHARLVELKWGSDDPLSALRQILRYGATYIFCRVHRNALPLRNLAIDGCPSRLARSRRAASVLQRL